MTACRGPTQFDSNCMPNLPGLTHRVRVHVPAHPHGHLLYPTHTYTHTLCRTWWTGRLAQSVPLDGLHSMILIYSFVSHSVDTQLNNAVITEEVQEWKEGSNIPECLTERKYIPLILTCTRCGACLWGAISPCLDWTFYSNQMQTDVSNLNK